MIARRLANSGAARGRKLRGLGVVAMDERGVSAIEFALMAPVLIVMFMGLCDLSAGVMTQLHVDRAAEGTGDVTAAYNALQTSDMVDMFTVADQFLQPYSATPLNVRITDIYSNQNGSAKVYWSCSLNNYTANTTNNLAPYAANSTVSTANGTYANALVDTKSYLPDANSSVIMVEINYTFTSPTNQIISGTHLMTSTAYLQPRQGLYVGFPWSGGSTLPTAPNSTTTSSSLTLSNGATCNYRQ
jgi:Flp pilus assembly protein TadG